VKMIKKILVGVKGDKESNNVLRYAVNLARITKSKLTALHVIETLDEYNFYEDIKLNYKIEAERDRDRCIQQIKDISEEYHLENLDIEIIYGKPTKSILNEAKRGEFDLIIVGSHSRSNFIEFLLGGVAFQITHYAKRPVIIVKNLKEIDTILVCTDGSDYARDAIAFMPQIVSHSKSRVTVLHVAKKGQLKSADSEKIVNEGSEILKKMGIDTKIIIREGYPSKEILREARKRNYDLIVMGHKGKSSIREFFLGDVVSKVTHLSSRPILVYRAKKGKF